MRGFDRRVVLLGILAGLIGGCATNEAQNPSTPPLVANQTAAFGRESWLLVDTKHDKLMVMRGERPVQVFDQIAVGSSGAGLKSRRGDNKTPLGVFRVGWVNDHSKFKKFILVYQIFEFFSLLKIIRFSIHFTFPWLSCCS